MSTLMQNKRLYRIEEGCNSCGSCKVVCPTHAISKGKPYVIQAHKCIGCGLCVTRCWRKLIKRV